MKKDQNIIFKQILKRNKNNVQKILKNVVYETKQSGFMIFRNVGSI